MKSSRKPVVCIAIILGCVLLLRAGLPPWAENTVAGSALEAALYRVMNVPVEPVMHLRPPAESRSQLTRLINQSPHNAELYAIRAREEERALDFIAAEADWRHAADSSQEKLASLLQLGDYYHRRVEPAKEVSALLRLAAVPQQPAQRFQPDSQQTQWSAFARSINVANEWLLPSATREQVYEAWIGRYPKDTEPYQAYLNWLIQQKNRPAADALAARIKTAFPDDTQLAVSTEAHLASIQNGAAAALAVYSRNFSSFWPDSLKTEYFQALTNAHQLRAFLADAQSAVAANPAALDPVLRLYFYYDQQNRKDIADQQLIAFASRKSAGNAPWTPDELKTIAPLFQHVQDYDESAHSYYVLYELPNASAADKELALASLVSLLLDVPEQPLHFGNRDLSLYKNVGRIDRHPGFLNGILSLALNTTFPDFQYQSASQTAVSYFHRASASRLLEKLKQQFPNSSRIPELEAKLFNAYGVYGQYDAVIRFVPSWLIRNPASNEYVDTALLLADAYVASHNTTDELGLYDRLLTELADKSDRVPIGEQGVVSTDASQSTPARSPDYARVLDRYVSRLVQLGRPLDAVKLFRQQLDRNPDDPGIYQRLALFVEQNKFDADLEQTYRQAFARFKNMSWLTSLRGSICANSSTTPMKN